MKQPTFTLTLTQAQFRAAASQLGKLGLAPESGTLPETEGVQLSYVSSGTTVVFTVDRKPRLMPVTFIEGHVKKLLGIG